MTYFADTFYFLAILNRTDDMHAFARQIADQRPGRIVTTQWVLAEVADGMRSPRMRRVALDLIRRLALRADVTVVEASSAYFERGLALYAERPDKEWSLTDCISFVVMLERKITQALTADHHFEQADFTPLLK